MKKEKFFIKDKLCSILIFLLFSIISCQPKDKFEWNAGISAPKNYIAGGPFVEYFYNGESVAGTSSNTGIDPGWGNTSGGYTGGEKFKPIPDSVVVNWRCGVDLVEYKMGKKLPREKMLELFKNKFVGENGNKGNYTQIVTGFAPSGNVTIWLSGGRINTEIIKFKASPIKEYDPYDSESVTLWTSTGEEAKEIFKYLYIHGLPYKIWETGEKEYDYEVGFSNMNDFDFSLIVHLLSKEGSYIFMNEDEYIIPYKKWLENKVTDKLKKGKLPVHMNVQWVSKDNQQWYEGEIILPSDFKTTFENFSKKNKVTNIFLVMDKVNPNDNFAMGTLWLQSQRNKDEVMKFRLAKANVLDKKFPLSKYSLPKNYQIQKWEGRVPIQKPTDFDFYQEP